MQRFQKTLSDNVFKQSFQAALFGAKLLKTTFLKAVFLKTTRLRILNAYGCSLHLRRQNRIRADSRNRTGNSDFNYPAVAAAAVRNIAAGNITA